MNWYLGEMADQPKTDLQLLAQKPKSLVAQAYCYGRWSRVMAGKAISRSGCMTFPTVTNNHLYHGLEEIWKAI